MADELGDKARVYSQRMEKIRARVLSILTLCDPEKVGLVDMLLNKFEGRERELFGKLENTYGSHDKFPESKNPFDGGLQTMELEELLDAMDSARLGGVSEEDEEVEDEPSESQEGKEASVLPSALFSKLVPGQPDDKVTEKVAPSSSPAKSVASPDPSRKVSSPVPANPSSSPVKSQPTETFENRIDGIACRIKDVRTEGEKKARVTLFRVEIMIRNTKRMAVVEKRFSEFQDLYDKLLDWFSKFEKDRVSKLPEFILKRSKFFENHFSEKFINDRRILLADWFRRTLESPLVAINAHMHDFLTIGEFRDEIVPVKETTFGLASGNKDVESKAAASIGNEDL